MFQPMTRSGDANQSSISFRIALLFFLAVMGTHCLAQSSILVTPTATSQARVAFAKNFQQDLASNGTPVQVTLSGNDKSTMRLDWRGLTSQSVYQMVTSAALSEQAKATGLKTIIFSKGTRGRWDYDVQRESMVWQPTLE